MHFGGRFLGRSSRANRRVPQAPKNIIFKDFQTKLKLKFSHQHHRESLAAQYLTALNRMDKVYQLLEGLNYCVEFSEH
jgi:hypothetical protein